MRYVRMIILLLFISNTAGAEIINYFGLYVGGVHEIGSLSGHLKTGFQAGAFLETGKILLLPAEINANIICLVKTEDTQTRLTMFPVSLLFVYDLQNIIQTGKIRPSVKAGLGVVPQLLNMSDHTGIENVDPSVSLAIDLKGRVTDKIVVLLQVTWLHTFQKNLQEAKYNGNFLSFTLGIAI
ncbi:MAG: hypothetical protein JW973_18305 [Bacteroidales bacterium]|nr:hypothetical protein [Bacteroidales bacterium]